MSYWIDQLLIFTPEDNKTSRKAERPLLSIFVNMAAESVAATTSTFRNFNAAAASPSPSSFHLRFTTPSSSSPNQSILKRNKFRGIPIGAEYTLQGVVDLVKMKAIVWSGEELGAEFSYQDIPADFQELAEGCRASMIETIVELDDTVMEDYLEGIEPDEETNQRLRYILVLVHLK